MDLTTLPAPLAREAIPKLLGRYVEGDGQAAARAVAAAAEVLGQAEDEALRSMLAAFGALGDGWRAFPAEPLARRMGRAFMAEVLLGGGVDGVEHLEGLGEPGVVWVGNHLSYIDTQVTDALLVGAGFVDLADRLLVVAGPKVYTEPFRRVAAMSLSTLKTAQSAQLAHNVAELSPREVARIAIGSVQQAAAWRAAGGDVLIYPEGSRSRDGRQGSFLRGAARYLMGARALLPVAVVGTQRLFPVVTSKVNPGPVRLVVGAPVSTEGLKRDALLERAWHAVAALQPEAQAPALETLPLR